LRVLHCCSVVVLHSLSLTVLHCCSLIVVHCCSFTVAHCCSSTVKHFSSLTVEHCCSFLVLHFLSFTVLHFSSHSGSRKHMAGLVGVLDLTKLHSLLGTARLEAERISSRSGTWSSILKMLALCLPESNWLKMILLQTFIVPGLLQYSACVTSSGH